MRGAARRNNTSKEVINKIFEVFDGYISTLTISGGEPSLNIDALEDIHANMCYSDNVHSVYIVTNGKVYRERFLVKVRNLFGAVCYDEGANRLAFSFDKYHGSCLDSNQISRRDNNYMRTKDWFEDRGDYDVVSKHSNNNSFDGNLLAMGRASTFGTVILNPKPIDFSIENNELTIDEGELYINHKGYIFSNCNLSYEEMTKRSHFYVGNIMTIKDGHDLLRVIKFYNKRTLLRSKQQQD
jgi:hypothetical protein